jgi:ribonuclease HI
LSPAGWPGFLYAFFMANQDIVTFMTELILLTDGSVHAQSKIGFGAYLAFSETGASPEQLKGRIQLRRFEQTSSTRIELQTLLWALTELQTNDCSLTVYTDSQNIVGLPDRRARLEQTDFRSAQGKRLNNYELYQQFYSVTDRLNCQIVKVRGHQVAQDKDEIDRLFTLVDRAARRALRADQSISLTGRTES